MLAAAASWLLSCKKDADSQPTTGTVAFELANMVGTKALALDGTVYTTASGETFTVSTFKYYLSNVKFTKTDGSTYAAPGEYHLVDAAKASSTSFTISNVPSGDYTGVSFVVGVDSTTTKGDPLALTGDLNPANNMYWAWSSGHIFLKLEGTATSGSAPNPITCHVGGYRQPYSAIVTASPSLNGSTLLVRAGQSPKILFAADVLKMFDGASPGSHVALGSFQEIMMPGTRAVQIAQNYAAGMFTVKSLQAN
ncbi:MbnP family protein [Hymenobacter cheonanensis]|uniref:MbnP family protein n=1 Tax=Hymenobacter sp. CA2-7 TaxID=3063993 RepID=UPI00272A18BE|nr:MbnP family protein [Hymenobacter sp. CA2-7]